MGTVRPTTDFAGDHGGLSVDTPSFRGQLSLPLQQSRVRPSGYVCGRRKNGRKHESTPIGESNVFGTFESLFE
jgi:hypothetical protein